jgi:hypothetical protein
MKAKTSSTWRLLLLCIALCIPLFGITQFRDVVYRVANSNVPSWQQKINTELFSAIGNNDFKKVQQAVRQGADVNAKIPLTHTALFHSLLAGPKTKDCDLLS